MDCNMPGFPVLPSIGASASVLPMNIQAWFPLGLTGLIFLPSKGLSRVFSNTRKFEGINSSALNLLYGPTLTSIHDYWKNLSFDYMDLCQQSVVSVNTLVNTLLLLRTLGYSLPVLLTWQGGLTLRMNCLPLHSCSSQDSASWLLDLCPHLTSAVSYIHVVESWKRVGVMTCPDPDLFIIPPYLHVKYFWGFYLVLDF